LLDLPFVFTGAGIALLTKSVHHSCSGIEYRKHDAVPATASARLDWMLSSCGGCAFGQT